MHLKISHYFNNNFVINWNYKTQFIFINLPHYTTSLSTTQHIFITTTQINLRHSQLHCTGLGLGTAATHQTHCFLQCFGASLGYGTSPLLADTTLGMSCKYLI